MGNCAGLPVFIIDPKVSANIGIRPLAIYDSCRRRTMLFVS